jgi:hypothetical protein
MSIFRIEVLLADRTVLQHGDRIGTLDEAIRAAWSVAEEISLPYRIQNAHVRWVDLFERSTLLLSISITPGLSLTGEAQPRSETMRQTRGH